VTDAPRFVPGPDISNYPVSSLVQSDRRTYESSGAGEECSDTACIKVRMSSGLHR
jgi:hypothetical protein